MFWSCSQLLFFFYLSFIFNVIGALLLDFSVMIFFELRSILFYANIAGHEHYLLFFHLCIRNLDIAVMLSDLSNSFSVFVVVESRHADVKAGQLLQGIVRNIDKTRKVVYLSSESDAVSKCVVCFSLYFSLPRLDIPAVLMFICKIFMQMKDLKGVSIDLLVPGMMVNARVQSTLENGIMLSFLTYFTGTVSFWLSCHGS